MLGGQSLPSIVLLLVLLSTINPKPERKPDRTYESSDDSLQESLYLGGDLEDVARTRSSSESRM